jgi:hypothetical protein
MVEYWIRWRTLITAGSPRASDLISARNHGIRPTEAGHAALAVTPWMPLTAA